MPDNERSFIGVEIILTDHATGQKMVARGPKLMIIDPSTDLKVSCEPEDDEDLVVTTTDRVERPKRLRVAIHVEGFALDSEDGAGDAFRVEHLFPTD